MGAWAALPVWLDGSFAAAARPGHAVAVALGCFVVMGFPAWVVHRLR
jgi:hypothetical protein